MWGVPQNHQHDAHQEEHHSATARPTAMGKRKSNLAPRLRSARMPGLASAFMITTVQSPLRASQSTGGGADPERGDLPKTLLAGWGGGRAPGTGLNSRRASQRRSSGPRRRPRGKVRPHLIGRPYADKDLLLGGDRTQRTVPAQSLGTQSVTSPMLTVKSGSRAHTCR